MTGTVSADYAQAGARQAFTGNATQPYGEQVLQGLGLSPQAAAYTYAALGMAPAAVEAVALNRAVDQASKYNNISRASYEPFTTQGLVLTPEIIASPQVQAMMQEAKVANPILTQQQIIDRVSQ